jgi:hypothetical protein
VGSGRGGRKWEVGGRGEEQAEVRVGEQGGKGVVEPGEVGMGWWGAGGKLKC